MAYAPSNAELRASGLVAMPGLGVGYPELKRIAHDIIAERVASLSWVPPDFAQKYAYFTTAMPDAVITLYPALGALGQRNFESKAATFIDTPQKEAMWTNLARDLDAARGLYAMNKANEARQKLADLNANSFFWNQVGGAFEGAGSVLKASASGVKSAFFYLTLAAVGAGVFYWYYKDPEGFKRFFRSFGGKGK